MWLLVAGKLVVVKVLLAPLFFQARMCKHCARIVYRENPDSWLGLLEFESLPPLGSYHPKDGFIPDFPALLMFDEFVIDGEAYERMLNPGRRWWLAQWRELIRALDADGALTPVDLKAVGKERARDRGVMLRRDLREPTTWAQALSYYGGLTARAERLLGASPKEAQALAWDFEPDFYGVVGPDGHSHSPAGVLLDGPDAPDEAHRALYDFALAELRIQLREVNACVVTCEQLGVAPMMWAPYSGYMDTKFGLKAGVAGQQAAREFFKIAFPAYAPTSVSQFAKARDAKAITSLRQEILRASETGDVLDSKYPQRVLAEVLRIERSSAKTRRIVGWISTLIGSIPVPGAGVAASAAGEATNALLERRKRKPLRWLYMISDGRGLT